MQYNSYVNRQWVMLYLIYSARIIMIITMMFFVFFSSSWIRLFPGILSLLKPPSPRLHRNWFHNGCQTGFLRISSFISVLQKPHISRKLPFQERRGRISWIISPFWLLMNCHWFLLTSRPPKLGKQTFLHQVGKIKIIESEIRGFLTPDCSQQFYCVFAGKKKKSSKTHVTVKGRKSCNSKDFKLKMDQKNWEKKREKTSTIPIIIIK